MKWPAVVIRKFADFLSLITYKLVSSRYLVNQRNSTSSPDPIEADFGIVIVTFELRQSERAIPLLKQIRLSGISAPIALVVNGNFNGGYDSDLRQKLFQELADIPNVYLTMTRKFHGLSHNWNLGIRLLGCKSTLVLNDDIWIDLGSFKAEVSRIRALGMDSPLTTINRSFSHFLIDDSALNSVGWFDERFVGIGEEDGDYYLRYCDYYNKPPLDVHTNAVVHFNDANSGSEIKGVTKYSLANLVFAGIKYGSPPDGNPGFFGELRIPNFDSSYRLDAEDFRRSLGPWEELNELELSARMNNLLSENARNCRPEVTE